MILTLTANPSIDRTVELSTALTRGTAQRATHVVQEAGGKGINVSRALAKSGMLTLAILPGDDDDPVLAGLRTAFLPFRNLPIGVGLRTNTAITEPDERGGLACRASARCGAFTVGAGDSALAGYLLAHSAGELPENCLRQAVAHGSAATALPGSTIPSLDQTTPAAVVVTPLMVTLPVIEPSATGSTAGRKAQEEF